MSKIRLIVILIYVVSSVRCQKSELNIAFGGGINTVFADGIKGHQIGGTYYTGINYILNRNSKALLFNPGLFLNFSQYQTNANEEIAGEITEHTAGLNLEVLFHINKTIFIRTGFDIAYVVFSDPAVILRNYSSGYYAFSSNEIYDGYNVRKLNGRIVLGISIPLENKKTSVKRFKFNATLIQNATSMLLSRYNPVKNSPQLNDKFWNENSKPFFLTIGFDINVFAKRAKSKEADTE